MGLSHEGRRIQDSLTPCYDLYDILYNQSLLRQPPIDYGLFCNYNCLFKQNVIFRQSIIYPAVL